MPVLEWSPELEIGIFEIDLQHRSLVSIANQLHDAVESGKADQTIEWILEELLLYTKMHFQTEEQYMRRYAHAESEQHKTDHAEMLKAMRRFKRKLKADDEALADDVLVFLRDWLHHHLTGPDRALGDAYRKDARSGSGGGR